MAAVTATAVLATGPRQYRDDRDPSHTVTLKGNSHRVLSATLLVGDPDFLSCDERKGSVVGGWEVRNIPIKNGRFHGVRSESDSDSLSHWVSFRGTISDDKARGSVSLRIYHAGTGPGKLFQCWSGGSKAKPAVPFAATAK